jgi:ArsR family metal-binding transcriptional regulator
MLKSNQEVAMKVREITVGRPECNSSFEFVKAIVHMEDDLSWLLPYLNATQEGAHYYPKNPYIDFSWGWHKVVVEKDQVRIVPFEDEKAAREGAVKLVELLKEVESRRDEIVPDHTPYSPPRVMDILKLLPKKGGCAECGYQTCIAFATALVGGEALPDACAELRSRPELCEDFTKLKELIGV